MPPVRHLPHAPIREALLDIRVELPAEFSAEAFKELADDVGLSYPKIKHGSKMVANLKLDPNGGVSSESADMGLHSVLFVSADEKTVAQFRTDGFTLNRLRPYTQWDAIFPEAMRLWAIYSEAVSPTSVAKIGLRYINDFQLPGGVPSVGRYLHSTPSTVPGAPGRPKGFLARILNEVDDGKVASVVTYSIGETAPSQTQVVLDIDVTYGAVSGNDSASLTPHFAALRTIKNDIFFGFVTEETLSLFN